MPWQFRVVDGADQGRFFPLPDVGIFPIGSSRKHAEVVLNDLYVARIHAEVEVEGARVVITDHESPAGTMVNGQRVRQQELRHGDVVRMGNSHIRLEDVDTAAKEAPPAEEEVPAFDIEVLPEGEEAAATEADVVEPAEGEVEVVEVVEDAVTGGEAHALPIDRLRELVGHALAHFQVEEVIGIGRGSMLFQARDLKKDQLVALKVLAPDFPHSDEEMKHYVQVWKAVLPLRHPNLVPLFGVGKTGPYCWLSMEHVECASLPDIIERISRKDRIDWHRGYRVAVQIGRALQFAHRNKVVHRNITAHHILWRSGDKVAKLVDLGLSAALQGSNLMKLAWREKLQTDLVYYSPEQTEPENYVDGVCDIYSLGVVVYALLTGRYPFIADSQAETIRKIREAKPKSPTKLQPEIPKRLEAIVLKMLAKRQQDRYQTADDVLADLQIVGEEEDAPV